jgi:hypothetical protein
MSVSTLGSASTIVAILMASPAFAEGPIIITQETALKGICPGEHGDTGGFPITLSCHGSKNFRLGSDLRVPANRRAFDSFSNGTLDLGGFTVSGGGSANYFMAQEPINITIKNGTITGFRYGGIVFQNTRFDPAAYNWTIENVNFINNGGYAISASGGEYGDGEEFTFRHNVIIGNDRGIFCEQHCVVEGNIISNNKGTAIAIDANGTIIGNTIIDNGVGIAAGGQNFGPVYFGANTLTGNQIQTSGGGDVPLVPTDTP